MLQMALGTGARVLLVIDGVDMLDPSLNSLSLDWLPKFLPPGVRAIVSCAPGNAAAESVHKRDPACPIIDLPPLRPEECKLLVTQQLVRYRKKLLPTQMELLLSKTEAMRPLYAITACEELRLQAQYGLDGTGVDDFIRALPQYVDDLFDVVLRRVEADMDEVFERQQLQVIPPSPLSRPLSCV